MAKPKKTKPTAKAPRTSSRGSHDLAELEQILEIMAKHGIAELKWERPTSGNIHLKTPASFVASGPSFSPQPMYAPAPVAPAPVAAAPVSSAPAPAGKPVSGALAPNQKQVPSPFVGTFYRASSPGNPPYVTEGQSVKPGDVLCLVEAMKLMNEIESEYSGRVISILVENGQPVEFGEPLFIVET
jgi:acetyl-CoA carboxylase biotin carboxyl carrier protein